jgi:hypothetical protein
VFVVQPRTQLEQLLVLQELHPELLMALPVRFPLMSQRYHWEFLTLILLEILRSRVSWHLRLTFLVAGQQYQLAVMLIQLAAGVLVVFVEA